jgi:hypothetical protein
MRLVGDADGIAALKELVTEHRDYLRFLIAEAQSNTDHAAGFRGKDGAKWELVARPGDENLEIRKSAAPG